MTFKIVGLKTVDDGSELAGLNDDGNSDGSVMEGELGVGSLSINEGASVTSVNDGMEVEKGLGLLVEKVGPLLLEKGWLVVKIAGDSEGTRSVNCLESEVGVSRNDGPLEGTYKSEGVNDGLSSELRFFDGSTLGF